MNRLKGARQLMLPLLLLAAVTALTACGGGSSGGGSSSSSSSSSSGGGSSSSSGAVALCPNLPQADGLFGQSSYAGAQANPGGASASTLSSPIGAPSGAGNSVYLADTANHRVLAYSPIPGAAAGAASLVIGQPDAATVSSGTAAASGTAIKFDRPARAFAGASDSATYFVVADSANNRVLIWNKPPASKDTAPDVVLGQADLSGSGENAPTGTPSASSLSNPASAVIAGGYLVVVDQGNNRILLWKGIPTADVSTHAATIVLGQSDFTTNTQNVDQFSSATQSYILAMRQPGDAWTDGTRLLVSDTGNHRVLYWSAMPAAINRIADHVIGQSQFGSTSLSGGSGTTGLRSPWGVAADGVNIFVADTGNNRVLEYANYLNTPVNGPVASDVFGQADFVHITNNDPDQNNQVGDQSTNPAGNGVTAGTLFAPQGVAVSGSELYVSDTGNNRVLRFAVSSGVDGTAPVVPCTH